MPSIVSPLEEDDMAEHLASLQLYTSQEQNWTPRTRTSPLPTLHEDTEYVSFIDFENPRNSMDASSFGF